jgi:hypothetical protein
MTHAFAIGYDWLYDVWNEEQRALLRRAMVEKGLEPALQSYRGQARFGWWVRAYHNWNQVCNGGIGIGALALAEAMPDLAREILHHALTSLTRPMSRFAPDGAWAEGPGYWNYATSYNVLFLAALQTALGTDFGFSTWEGFAETGLFPIHMTGPTGLTFNFADAHAGTIRAPQMFWLARRFNRPLYAWYERQHARPHPLDLILFDARGQGPAPSGEPLDKYFRRVEVVTLRSAWEDPKALFVGLKAGDNKANHSHLDLGTFVLDALGHRWALDLGSDNYNLPGYFGRQRWTYYRLRAEGHNTLVIHPDQGPDQNPRAEARIVRFESQPQRAFAVADLTPAYAAHAQRVWRGVALLDRRRVLVQDEVSTKEPTDVWWFLHTRAAIELEKGGRRAVLREEGERLEARLLAPRGARFSVMEAEPLPTSPHPERQGENRGVRKLAIHLSNVDTARIAVLLTPFWQGKVPSEDALTMVPLEEW